MTMLLIRCPTTHKLVGTNIHAEKDSFESETLPDHPPVQCTGCEKTHMWDKQDVVPQTWRFASGSGPTWTW